MSTTDQIMTNCPQNRGFQRSKGNLEDLQHIENKPVRDKRASGFEPPTSSLGSWHSTTELRPQVLIHIQFDGQHFFARLVLSTFPSLPCWCINNRFHSHFVGHCIAVSSFISIITRFLINLKHIRLPPPGAYLSRSANARIRGPKTGHFRLCFCLRSGIE